MKCIKVQVVRVVKNLPSNMEMLWRNVVADLSTFLSTRTRILFAAVYFIWIAGSACATGEFSRPFSSCFLYFSIFFPFNVFLRIFFHILRVFYIVFLFKKFFSFFSFLNNITIFVSFYFFFK